jgi:hypothetical protein
MQSNLNADGSPRGMDRNSGAIYCVTPLGKVTQLTPRELASRTPWLGPGTADS